jgi:hypothetical protein
MASFMNKPLDRLENVTFFVPHFKTIKPRDIFVPRRIPRVMLFLITGSRRQFGDDRFDNPQTFLGLTARQVERG